MGNNRRWGFICCTGWVKRGVMLCDQFGILVNVVFKQEQVNHITVVLVHINLERRVFDFSEFLFTGTMITLLDSKNSVAEGCIRV